MGYILKLTVILMIVAGIAAAISRDVELKNPTTTPQQKGEESAKTRAGDSKEAKTSSLLQSPPSLPYTQILYGSAE